MNADYTAVIADMGDDDCPTNDRAPLSATCHCWEDGPETEDGCSTTCMLLADHDGPHAWTRDDSITITFADADDPLQ